MVDRLYENMLGLIRDSQEQYCNSTLCNLNGFINYPSFEGCKL